MLGVSRGFRVIQGGGLAGLWVSLLSTRAAQRSLAVEFQRSVQVEST